MCKSLCVVCCYTQAVVSVIGPEWINRWQRRRQMCFVSSCSTPEKASPDKAVSDKEGEGK